MLKMLPTCFSTARSETMRIPAIAPLDRVPLEYTIERLTCVANSLDAVDGWLNRCCSRSCTCCRAGDQGDQQPAGEHQLVFWPSAGLAPPGAAAPLAAPGLTSRLPPRREFGDKLAKVSP